MLFLACAFVNAQAVDLYKDKVLYGVTTAHLDTIWKWTIQDTIRQDIPKTLRQQFELMDRYSNYTFSFEGAYRYMLAKEYYPEDYAKLRHYIDNGQWRVAGSSVDAGDTNVPSPESLIRQILYGNGFFRKEFGKTSVDIFLPDCFGFGYALPSVAAHCGLRGFSTQKLSWGAADGIPFDIGTWEGPDGSSIVAALKPGDYIATADRDYAEDAGSIEKVEALGKLCGVYAGYRYFGCGDEGGSLNSEQVGWLETSADDRTGPIRFLSAGSDQLFRDLTPDQVAKLPHYKGELLMTTHGVGCYTAHSEMKRMNRKNEQLGDAAERSAVAADWLGGIKYPTDTLRQAWIRFLDHQFHDDITGTSIPQAYVFSWNDELLSQNQFAYVFSDSVGAVSRALDTQVKGVPVVVVNPLSIRRQDVVSARVTLPDRSAHAVRVFGPDGKEVPSQIVNRRGSEVEVLLLADVPSVSFSVFSVVPSSTPYPADKALSVSRDSMENSRYRVKLDANGDVASMLDKATGKELLAGPMRLELRRDNPDGFFSWEIPYRDDAAPPRGHVEGPVTIRITERGPVRVSLEIVRHAADSTFVQTLRLANGSAGDRLEFDTRIDWKGLGTLVKATFPFTASNPEATYDLGLGTVQRGNNTKQKYEVPAQQWADMTATDGSYGAAVLNDCKYGWDKPADDLLRLSIVRDPAAGHYEGINDVGDHHLTYAICGHAGDWRQGGVAWQAARLNQPLYAFVAPKHSGQLGRSFSMAKVSTPQVAIRALKNAEDSDEIVVRLQELEGKAAGDVSVSFATKVVSAREVTGAEDALYPATVKNGKLVVQMKAYQPRTFAIKLEPTKTALRPVACKSLALPYDLNALSFDGARVDSGVDGRGHAIPCELFPPCVESGGISFAMGPAGNGRRNAVACKGQKLAINPNGPRTLYLLAASAAGDRDAMLKVGSKQVKLRIQDYTGFVGQWNSRVVDGEVISEVDPSKVRPGFMKPEPVAWVATHRHNAKGENEPYVFCYLFRYRIDIPRGASSVTLPKDDKVLIFAATLAEGANDDAVPVCRIADGPERVNEFLKGQGK